MVFGEIFQANKSIRVIELTLEFLLIFTGFKVTRQTRQPFSSTHCSRQEPSESTSSSLITLPLSLLPLISLAKLTALTFGVIIFVISFVEVMIIETSSHCRYLSCFPRLRS